jgi:hypothetical protein
MDQFFMHEPILGDPRPRPLSTHGPLTPEMLVVTRLVRPGDRRGPPFGPDRSNHDRRGRIALEDAGHLEVDPSLHHWHPSGDWSDAVWQGRLHGRGIRRAAPIRIEIEMAPWSTDLTELRVRPRSRHASQWGDTRLRRYFELSNTAAERLAAMLSVRPAPQRATAPERTSVPLVRARARQMA